MKTLYFCLYDGDLRAVFQSEKLAKEWYENNGGFNYRGTLANVAEVLYDNDNKIISVYGQDFDDWIESISDEMGTDEFDQTKIVFSENWAFRTITND